MKSKELKVGVFTAIALAMLYFGFNFLKGQDFFSNTNRYYVVYDNVDKLAASNSVLVNGVIVGRVDRIRILQDWQNKVLVELEIDSDVILGDSSKAILTGDFLGTKFILLDIDTVITRLDPGDTILAEVAKGTLAVLTETAEPVADNLQTTIRKLNNVLDNLSRNTQSLDSMFTRFKATPGLVNHAISNSSSKLDTLTVSLKSATDALKTTLTDLKPTIRNFQVLSDSLKRLEVNKTLSRAQASLDKLAKTIDKLDKGDNTASKLLTEDSLYVNLNRLLKNIDTLARHFNDNPKHFMAPLGKSQKKIERDRKEAEANKSKPN